MSNDMKLIMENWRKLLEGDVIHFPHQPKISEEDLQFVIQLEDQIAQKLAAAHGNIASIPVKDIDKLDQILNDLEKLLKR